MTSFALRSDGSVASCGVTGETDSCGNVHVDNSGVMTISAVVASDSGYYMCSVTDLENNRTTTMQKIFRVRVLGLWIKALTICMKDCVRMCMPWRKNLLVGE